MINECNNNTKILENFKQNYRNDESCISTASMHTLVTLMTICGKALRASVGTHKLPLSTS